jgi:hypothetical protein
MENKTEFLMHLKKSLQIDETLSYMIEKKLLNQIIKKRPDYNTPKKREIIKDVLNDVVELFIQNYIEDARKQN